MQRSAAAWFVHCSSLLLFLACSSPLFAQRDLTDIPDPDPEVERASFEVAEGFEVNLFAADPLLAKPIHMNFDAAGRLWVASSEVYPQIKPGQEANDKILVLEDADGDGTADKTTAFADGLLIPTGVLPGDGGVYVANSTELLHLTDTDGDGRADRRRIVLSGFGTEDTHHILHTLRWGPDGAIYMNQSIYIHSHIETPYGVRRMNGGGVWRFRPDTLELETYTLGLVNPWGHAFDLFGQSFMTDGAGGEGINYVFPGWVGITSPGAKRVMHGLNPGSPKYCGLEVISGRHFPPDWLGNLITCDFRAHRVVRFSLAENQSGFSARLENDLIRTKHVAFRPVDVKMGPDGALYIADWYNPIIQHGEVDFRDPRRDHVHGRIWRVTAKGRPLVKRPKIVGAPLEELLDMLLAPEDSTRLWAKQELKTRDHVEVFTALERWIDTSYRKWAFFDHVLLEIEWLYQTMNSPPDEPPRDMLDSAVPQIRAAAVRISGYWQEHFDEPLAVFRRTVNDEHPRVRLEAVRALGRVHTAEACEVAMQALDHPVDENLDFALWTTARDLKDVWLPALERGEIDFDGNVEQMIFALKAVESNKVVPLLIERIGSRELPDEQRQAAIDVLGELAGPAELRTLFDMARVKVQSADVRAQLLVMLADAAESRKVRPAGDLTAIRNLVKSDDASVRGAAFLAAGAWRDETVRDEITRALFDAQEDPAVRKQAILALTKLGGPASAAALEKAVAGEEATELRVAAISGLTQLNVTAAAAGAVSLLKDQEAGHRSAGIVQPLLEQKQGPAALAKALDEVELPPDHAKLALRAVRSSGQPHPELEAALIAAGGLKSGPKQLSPQAMAALVREIRASGDAARGEAVYRRAELNCMKCHAIGGAGGRVGPDLVSIGASAQPDYLVESLLDPGQKIKENYHSVIVLTDTGKVIAGVKLRQSDTALILRDAEDREIEVPLDAIEGQKDGGSLMPAGLADELTRGELIDLVRFLSELGKVGPYMLGREAVVRRWETLPSSDVNHRVLHRKGHQAAGMNNPELVWAPVYSKVDGSLPLADIPAMHFSRYPGAKSFVRFAIDVTSAGEAILRFNDVQGLTAWLDGELVRLSEAQAVALSTGRREVTLAIDRAKRQTALRIELEVPPGSQTQAQLVTGK